MTPWEVFMGFVPGHAASQFSTHVKIGETSGWVALALSLAAGVRGVAGLMSNLTPDSINPWLILIASTATGAVAVGTLAYSRIIRAKLDGDTLEAIYAANNRAIQADKPVPFPAFMPRGALTTITTTTVVDVTTKPKPTETQP